MRAFFVKILVFLCLASIEHGACPRSTRLGLESAGRA